MSHRRIHCSVTTLCFALMFLVISVGNLSAQTEPPDSPQLDVMVIVDMSGSMCCTLPINDPYLIDKNGNATTDSQRVQMARLFVNFLGSDQSSEDYRLGFVFFGTDAEVGASLTSVADQENLAELLDNIKENEARNMRWTDVKQALQVALDEVTYDRPDAQKAIVLLTDGEPRLPDWTDEDRDAYTDELKQFVNQEWPDDIPVYTVAFTEEAFREDPENEVYKNLWEEIATVTGAPADVGYQEAEDVVDLAEIYINIIRSLLGLPPEDLPPPEQVPVTKQFKIIEDLLQVIFVVLKDNPEITTTITQPNGEVLVCPLESDDESRVQCIRSEREESISIQRPEQGLWEVALDGQGFIQFQAVPFPISRKYGFNLVSPAGAHPAGKPMEIVARAVQRESGEIEATDNVTVTVEKPSGASSAPIPMLATDDDNFVAVFEDTIETGVYSLRFSGDIADGTLAGESSVRVLAAPWIKIMEPVGDGFPSNQTLPLEAQLMLSTEPLEQLDPTWSFTVTSSLFDESGKILSTTSLVPEPGGLFRGEADTAGEGSRTTEVSLLIETAGGEQFTDISQSEILIGAPVTLTPTPSPTITSTPTPTTTPSPTLTPTPTPIPPPPPEPPSPAEVGGGIGLLLLLLGGGIAGFWYYRLPSLSGDIVELGEAGEYYILKGKRPWTIGSDPGANITLSGTHVAAKHAQLKPHSRGIDLVNLVSDTTDSTSGDLGDDLEGFASLEVQSRGEISYHEIIGTHLLRDGDKIRIGKHILEFQNPTFSDDDFFSYDDMDDDTYVNDDDLF